MHTDIIKAYVNKKELGIKKKSGVYGIFNKINRKIYIGASKNIRRRFNEHISSLRNNEHTNPYLQESFNKYEERNFDFIVLEYCSEDKSILSNAEKFWIDFFNSCDLSHGYNMQSGGDIGYTLKQETKDKIKEKLRSSENKLKMSKKYSGKNNPNYKSYITICKGGLTKQKKQMYYLRYNQERFGYSTDLELLKMLVKLYFPEGYLLDIEKFDEIKQNISIEINKNARKKISEFHKNKKLTKKQKEKIKERMKRDKNPMYQKTHTLEDSLKISKSRNTTGIYRVSIRYGKRCDSVYYRYMKNGKTKQISDKKIEVLEKKILDLGLPWVIIDKEKAEKTYEVFS